MKTPVHTTIPAHIRHPLLSVLAASTLLLALTGTARAQAGVTPLSSAKLLLPSADPVPEGRLELGLHFQMGWSHRVFDDKGGIDKVRSLETDALMGVRLTYGLVDERWFGMEIGTILPVVFRWGEDYEAATTHSEVGLGNVPLATKMRILQERDWSISLALGGETPTGDRNGISSGYGRVGGGLLVSARLVEGLTMDFVVMGDGIPGLKDRDRAELAAWGLETAIGFSWLERRGFFRIFTPCLELGHRVEVLTRGAEEQRIRHRLAMNAGFAIQLSKRVVMTQAARVDLAGTNGPMGAGWVMNTTILL